MDDEAVLTVKELKQLIFEKATFFEGGESLQLSLSNVLSDKFDKWVDDQINYLKELGEEFLSVAELYGPLMT